MRLHKLLIITILYLTLFSCNKKETTGFTNRPLDHWVFRSVLDLNPRMITLALNKDIWVSYHAETGALYKAWKGSVYFDGAVYTTAHGPQPISIGNSYVENKYKNPWFVTNDAGDTLTTIFDYKGHRFINGKAELMYQLNVDKLANPIFVFEEIEASTSASGSPVLERKFTLTDVPDGIKVHLKFNLSSIVVENNISTDGKVSYSNKEDIKYDNLNVINVDGVLTLNNNGLTKFNTTFIPTPTIINKNIAGGVSEEEKEENSGALPEGLKLIAKSDCRTCHNKTLQTIGPSYTAIAKRYKNTEENIALLSGKIKKGGFGIWGEQAMTPHPDLDEEELNQMVVYVLSLDNDEEQAEPSATETNTLTMSPVSGLKEEDMLPGSIVKAFTIPSTSQKVPVINSGQKPKYAGVLQNFDNLSGGDFKDLKENFALVGTGYVKIDTAGTYTFQIWSDDGSIVYIGDKKVMDNDGPHGAEYKDVSIRMTKGYYPFKIDYYQGGGGAFLSFNWKKPGDKEYEVIPTFSIFHNKADQDILRDFKLPMANVSKVPGDQYPLLDVHPSFDLYQARPNSFKPKVGGMDFKSDGRLIVSTWDAAGSVFILDNVASGDTTKMTVKRIAFGLAEPLGVKVVNDTIYIMQKHEITRLIDTD
ncbi:MAG: glycosyl hydrolase, partial [Saprospiraceae bacterium]|nr:glycosyl hydrolase [Saprospiraceae bacterium]